jgi:putative glycosyltransferase (TIGR04372 family)
MQLTNNNFITRQINQISEKKWPVVRRKIKKLIFLPFNLTLLLLALPFVVIIRLLSPFFVIRLHGLDIGRIGGLYSGDIYMSEKKCGHHQSGYFDRFYFTKSINHVNQQWKKMWKRNLNVFFFAEFAKSIERINKLFPGYEKYQIPNSDLNPSRLEFNSYMSGEDLTIYDKYNKRLECVLRVSQPNLSFTLVEGQLGDKYLQEIGIPAKNSFICFHNRDSSYLDMMNEDYDWRYHDFRDSKIENYLDAAKEMIERGNYAIRLGAVTKEKIKDTSSKLIDYANNGMRTDFLDIYLSAKCKFIICSDTGMSFPAEVFKRPLVYVNWVRIIGLPIYALKGLVIMKNIFLKKENRYMTFSENLNLRIGEGGENELTSTLELEIIENSPEEIRAVTIEMDERLNGTWQTTDEDEELQQRFWAFFGPDKFKSPNLRIGTEYLRRNKELIK